MKNKEKKLTEVIERVLRDTLNCGLFIETLTDYLVDRIEDKVIPKDSVILSKERFDALETIEKYYIKSCGKNSVVLTEKEHEVAMIHQYDVGFSFGYEKGGKEMVEKIIKMIKQTAIPTGVTKYSRMKLLETTEEELNAIAKRLGVEIKE